MVRLRGRFALVLSLSILGVLLVLGMRLAAPRLEAILRSRILAEGARRGIRVQIEDVRARFYPLVRLKGVRLEKPGAGSIDIAELDVRLRPTWGELISWLRIRVGHAVVLGPQGVSLDVEPSEWALGSSPPGGRVLRLVSRDETLWLAWFPRLGREGRLELGAEDFRAGSRLTIKRGGEAVLEAGVLSGFCWTERNGSATSFGVEMAAQDLRLAAFSGESLARGETPVLGRSTDFAGTFEGDWDEGSLRLPRFSGSSEGARISGTLALKGVPHDPVIDLSLEVERLDFATILLSSGIAPTTAVLERRTENGDLGSASLKAEVRGRLLEPSSFEVVQKIDFVPPVRTPPEIARLRSDFVQEVSLPNGGRRVINVSPESPDFIALGDVPPLFLRTLLIGEDAGFFSHKGIDLREVPSAVLTNWARGTVARGASTITQQLAKNLFLSREKRLSRKVQELALSLLLESSLGKERILEIYLNIIEWGPDLHGLRPAARRYFHKEPKDLSPAEGAFLVALIPGPVKYQRAFADGTPAAWFLPLVNELLFKLRSVDALSQEEYDAAIAEPLTVATSDALAPNPDPAVP